MFKPLKPFVIAALASGWFSSAQADNLAGAYLAARQASLSSDFEAAAEYFMRALASDPRNPMLLESAISSLMVTGDFDTALPMARLMYMEGRDSQAANMVLIAGYFVEQDFDAAIREMESGLSVGGLLDKLATAWALVGSGDFAAALAVFDSAVAVEGNEAFALYNKALALAMVGDHQGADDIFSGRANGPLPATRNGVIAHVQVLSQLGKFAEARDLMDATLAHQQQPELAAYYAALVSEEPIPFSLIRTPADGLAEAYFDVADAIQAETNPTYTLLYSQMALALRPDHVPAQLLTASLLEQMQRFAMAEEIYAQVPSDHPQSVLAELGRAEAIKASGRVDEAISVLQDLSQSNPELDLIHYQLGLTLHGVDRHEEAVDAFNRAISMFSQPHESQWRTYFSRAISYERLGQWNDAEADFRYALELNPNQPFVLNYLGYSLVERQESLDEALAMIEMAVEAEPLNGYITDSLGWVLFRLGRYEEAAEWMERAVLLEPTDPVISNHLGDTLWAVGRYREAEFQWRRAMSFIEYDLTGEADPERIRRKIEVGLDQVLVEEGGA